MVFLRITNITKFYISGEKKRTVLDKLQLQVRKGDMVLIIGPSGSGKTTLLNLLGGIEHPDSGTILIGNKDISNVSDEELRTYRAENVGFIFQFYNLMPTLNTTENVELGCEVRQWSREKVKKESKKYLEKVGLKEELTKFPQQLSGGEQQRVTIARALAKHPKIILGDEPTGNLDEETSLQIIKLLRDVNKNYKTTMIIVSHDRALREYADTIFELKKGSLHEL